MTTALAISSNSLLWSCWKFLYKEWFSKIYVSFDYSPLKEKVCQCRKLKILTSKVQRKQSNKETSQTRKHKDGGKIKLTSDWSENLSNCGSWVCRHELLFGITLPLSAIELEYSVDLGLSWHPLVRDCLPTNVECSHYHLQRILVSDTFNKWTRITLPLPPYTRYGCFCT